MIGIKSADELQLMRESGSIAGRVRDALAKSIVPGMTTLELSDYASELMKKQGAESAFLGYMGYPGVICVSLNEEVVHGIPGKKRIQLGDIVSIDIGVRFKGYVGDTAVTVMVGVTNPEVIRLVRTTERALEAGIAMAVAGNRLSDISHAIERVAVESGFSVVQDFVGHGVGKKVHEEPQIPNFGPPGKGPVLKSGMVLALEPMINMGGHEVDIIDDKWTVVTRDRKQSAHFEHTIAITKSGAEILTK